MKEIVLIKLGEMVLKGLNRRTFEDVLIKNMIDKSKKKSATIRLNVSMELPPKEIYNTIRDVYEEGMADEFVKSVTARISMDNLLESLSTGMKKFYEGSDK